MRLLRTVLTLFLLLSFYSGLQAQKRCATVEYEKLKRSTGQVRESDEQFERALAANLKARKNKFLRGGQEGPYKIPVVVHVIHNGEETGVGRNLSDAQIQSQIDVLNKDFNRENADAINTPSEFVSVASSIDIEFVLARQDPAGNCTSGIVRVNGNRDQWTLGREAEFKALSYWPAEDYLNIWVINFSGFLGYASFPISSGLPGLEEQEDNRLTDGVIIDYTVFGSVDAGPFDLDNQYNKGRTTTHEVGHFLGLRHIWGDDDGCAESDYADDTPTQATETYQCNLTPASPVKHPKADACTAMKMFQNYMDYTDDVCMNLFTQDQVERMIVVLENSPRRKSLLTSHGLEEPSSQDQADLELADIDLPPVLTCAEDRDDKTPLTITINNVHDSDVDVIFYAITVNGEAPVRSQQPITFINNSGVIEITSLPGLVIGNNTITVEISGGGCDPTPENNALTFQVTLLDETCDPFLIYLQPDGQAAITFDLSETAPTRISIITLMGQEVKHINTPQTTNQTIPFHVSPGVYVVRVQIGTTLYARKVYLHP